MIYKEEYAKDKRRILKCGWTIIEKDVFNQLYNKYFDKLKEIMEADDFDSLQELVISIRRESEWGDDTICFMHEEFEYKDMEINLPAWYKPEKVKYEEE